MNFEAPSQCRGNVTSYRYCYYDSVVSDDDDGSDDGSDDDDDGDDEDFTYGAKLMIYRRESPTSDIYRPVAGSIRIISLSRSSVRSFQCRTEMLPTRFEIQENDVVGACIENENVNPLYLIGDTNDDSANYNLYQVDRDSFEDCTSSQIGTVDTSDSNFRQRRDFILHLYANIGKLLSAF